MSLLATVKSHRTVVAVLIHISWHMHSSEYSVDVCKFVSAERE